MSAYTTRSGRAIKTTKQFTIIEDDEEERRVREEERAWERGEIIDNDFDGAPRVARTQCDRKCTVSVDASECKHAKDDNPCDCECHLDDCGCTEECDLDECECECHDDAEGMDDFLAEEGEDEIEAEMEEEYEYDVDFEEEETEEEESFDEEEMCESDETCDCTPSAEAKQCRLTRRNKELCGCECHEIDDESDEESAAKRPRTEE